MTSLQDHMGRSPIAKVHEAGQHFCPATSSELYQMLFRCISQQVEEDSTMADKRKLQGTFRDTHRTLIMYCCGQCVFNSI